MVTSQIVCMREKWTTSNDVQCANYSKIPLKRRVLINGDYQGVMLGWIHLMVKKYTSQSRSFGQDIVIWDNWWDVGEDEQ